MNNREFVTAYFRRMGVVVEETGFELVDVLLPAELAAQFEFNTEVLRLAFDYEVAQENPGSVFVTYGSHLLDRLTRAALKLGRFVEVFWPEADTPHPPVRLERMLADEFDFVKCRAPMVERWLVHEHVYYRFDFRCVFQSYDKVEEITPVLVDGRTGWVQNELLALWTHIIPAGERLYHWPRLDGRPPAEIYHQACRHLDHLAGERADALEAGSAAHRDRELAKMERYFAETISTTMRRMSKTEDATRRQRLEQQLAAAKTDRRRREKDIRERYTVSIQAGLDGLVLYHQPKIELHLRVQQRNKTFPFILYYNPLDGRIEPPLCPHCRRPFRRVTRDPDGTPCCPECISLNP
ncbi:MAG: hypothetical protein IBX71_08970 [Candidatus Desulforudis sp.]|nr:hypothetical protein [Desulforudis sp.]